jgi:hypothetical protein
MPRLGRSLSPAGERVGGRAPRARKGRPTEAPLARTGCILCIGAHGRWRAPRRMKMAAPARPCCHDADRAVVRGMRIVSADLLPRAPHFLRSRHDVGACELPIGGARAPSLSQRGKRKSDGVVIAFHPGELPEGSGGTHCATARLRPSQQRAGLPTGAPRQLLFAKQESHQARLLVVRSRRLAGANQTPPPRARRERLESTSKTGPRPRRFRRSHE